MKLGNLLKKELKELLTLQAIVSMIFTCLLLVVLGQFMGGEMEEAINNSDVNIVNMDNSDFTDEMISQLPEYGANPTVLTLESDNYYDEMVRLDIKNAVIIPEGFGDSVINGSEPAHIKCIGLINEGGLSSSMTSISSASLTSSISQYVSDYMSSEKFGIDASTRSLIENPVVTVDYTA
ncbi:MAG: hypothetical protein IJ368_08515, partial [Oscillospiraceae bacterium]|nr:hypothetical protein [Oscillospiraceae bacterium]